MEPNQTELVAQPVESGASTVEQTETLSKADADFKRDMLKYKDELAAAKAQLQDIELEKQQKKGNFEGVISSLKDELKKAKAENTQTKHSFASTQLDNAIKSEASSRGITGAKLDAFLKLIDDNDKGVVEFDSSFNVNSDEVKSLVDKSLDRYSEVFSKPVKIVDGTPNSRPITNPAGKFNLDKANAADTIDYLLKNKDKLK